MRISVGTATTTESLHTILADVLGFPDYYGRNWDAFDECIREVPLPLDLEIYGIKDLRSRLPRDAELLEISLSEFQEEHDDQRVAIRFI